MDLDVLLRQNLEDLDYQIQALEKIAARGGPRGTDARHLQDKYGNFLMTPILIAKANVLLAMAIREQTRPKFNITIDPPPVGPYG